MVRGHVDVKNTNRNHDVHGHGTRRACVSVGPKQGRIQEHNNNKKDPVSGGGGFLLGDPTLHKAGKNVTRLHSNKPRFSS